MPRKSKKSTDAENPETQPAIEAAAGDETQVPEETTPKKKSTRSKKAAAAPVPAAEAPAHPQPPDADSAHGAAPSDAQAEMAAHTAETFDDAFEQGPTSDAREAAVRAAAEPEPAALQDEEDDLDEDADEDDEEDEEDLDEDLGEEDEEDEEEEDEEESAADAEEAEDKRPPAKLERLQKILAQAGIASRRHAEELITEGRIQVNGKVVTELGSKADPNRDHIRVDGKLLQGAERLRYFMLNKPRGYVTTVSDPEGRPTVMEFFAKAGERLYPVGRLDYLSEGLLLVTNDGELANSLTRAASGVEKTYLVKVSGQPSEEQILTLREGVSIDRGKPGEGRVRTAPARIRLVRPGDNPWFEVVLIEGRNRELRKMFEEIGHHVEKIRRVAYGPLVLDLEPGEQRELDAEELRLLKLAAEGKWKPKRLRPPITLPKEAGRSVDHEAGARGKRPYRSTGSRDERGPARSSGPARGTGGERRPFTRPEGGARTEGGAGRSSGGERRSFTRPGAGDSRATGRSFGRPQGGSERGQERGGPRRATGPQGGGRFAGPAGRGTDRGAERGAAAPRADRPQGGFDRGANRGGERGAGRSGQFGRATGGQDRGQRFPERGPARPPRTDEKPRFTPRPPRDDFDDERPRRPGGLNIQEEPRSGGFEERGAGRGARPGAGRGTRPPQAPRPGRPSGEGRGERASRPPRFDLPTEAGEQRRTDSRRPGRSDQGGERRGFGTGPRREGTGPRREGSGPRREGSGRSFSRPRREEGGFTGGDRPQRTGGFGDRPQRSRPTGATGERPQRGRAQGGDFRAERPRPDRGAQGRSESGARGRTADRPFTGERRERPAGGGFGGGSNRGPSRGTGRGPGAGAGGAGRGGRPSGGSGPRSSSGPRGGSGPRNNRGGSPPRRRS